MFVLGTRSRFHLQGVHPDLVRVVERAIKISTVDFTVIDGVRTINEQKQLVAKGASKTMNSRHIPGKDGYSKAVDLAAYVNGKISWDFTHYVRISVAMKQAAKELNIPLDWGGDWKSFVDGPHFQLPARYYP